MLFRKDIEPSCSYCKRGNPLSDSEVICSRKGVVAADGSCRAFRYGPLKRVPPRPVKLNTDKLTKEDFSL